MIIHSEREKKTNLFHVYKKQIEMKKVYVSWEKETIMDNLVSPLSLTIK